MTKSRLLEELSKLQPGAAVAGTLNLMAQGSPAGIHKMRPVARRIMQLIELCKAYSARAEMAGKGARPGELIREVDSKLHCQIEKHLIRFRYRLTFNRFISPLPGSPSAFPNSWYRPEVKGRQTWLIEAIVAPDILEAMQRGQLEGLRQCARQECEKWFYSARRAKRYCNEDCREKAWNESPAGQESNRNRQARYYATPIGRKKCLKRQASYYVAKEQEALPARRRRSKPR
jgi:hypothetical protein